MGGPPRIRLETTDAEPLAAIDPFGQFQRGLAGRAAGPVVAHVEIHQDVQADLSGRGGFRQEIGLARVAHRQHEV